MEHNIEELSKDRMELEKKLTELVNEFQLKYNQDKPRFTIEISSGLRGMSSYQHNVWVKIIL